MVGDSARLLNGKCCHPLSATEFAVAGCRVDDVVGQFAILLTAYCADGNLLTRSFATVAPFNLCAAANRASLRMGAISIIDSFAVIVIGGAIAAKVLDGGNGATIPRCTVYLTRLVAVQY